MRGASRLKNHRPRANIAAMIASGISSRAVPPAAAAGGRRARVDERVAHLRQQRGDRVERDERGCSAFSPYVRRDVDDRRAVEERLHGDLPDRLDVAEAHVQRRQQHPDADRERREQQHERDAAAASSPVPARPRSSANTSTARKFMPRLNSAVSPTDSGIDEPREAHLAQQALACQQALHAAGGRLGEEGPQHDRSEQVDGVVLDARLEPQCAREDDVQHAEEQQRPRERPEVAEHRAEVAQLELGDGERDREVPEAPQVVAEGRRARSAGGRPRRSRRRHLERVREIRRRRRCRSRRARSAVRGRRAGRARRRRDLVARSTASRCRYWRPSSSGTRSRTTTVSSGGEGAGRADAPGRWSRRRSSRRRRCAV